MSIENNMLILYTIFFFNNNYHDITPLEATTCIDDIDVVKSCLQPMLSQCCASTVPILWHRSRRRLVSTLTVMLTLCKALR